jgi:triacylglycerol lipase
MALGKEWNPAVKAATAELYAPLHRHHNNSGIKQLAELSYGDSAQQTLDIFVPAQGFDELGPVLLFLHADPNTGDKLVSNADGLFYNNVPRWVARMGGVGINANYRQSLSASGESSNDLRLLIEWARNNVSQYGGDPDSMLILGSGAGAGRVAEYLFDESAQPPAGPGIAGAILVGGAFTGLRPGLLESYQGQAVPIELWRGELDPAAAETSGFQAALCSKYGTCPHLEVLLGHNHISPIMSIDSVDATAAGLLIRFYHSVVLK